MSGEQIGEMSREQQLEFELRTVRHDLEHVVAERDQAQRRLDAYIRTHTEARQRIADLMAWCAKDLGNSLVHRRIRELLQIPEDAYPWQADLPSGRPDTREELEARVDELAGCLTVAERVAAAVMPVVYEVIAEREAVRSAAVAERDLLGRQMQSIHSLAARCEAEDRPITHGEIYQLLITDPADDERPWYSDVDIAVDTGLIQLIGDGDQLIANLPGDRAQILRDMLDDVVPEGSLHQRISVLEERIREALPIVEYVSAGRGYLGVQPYPDATARRVNAALHDALDITEPGGSQ